MTLYLIIILICQSIIILLNSLLGSDPWWFYLIYTISATIIVILIDGLVASFIRHQKEEKVDYRLKGFIPSNKAIKFFELIGVKRWKEHIPELGGFSGFHKNHVLNPRDDEYIKRFILETCYGIKIHYVSVPVGFLIMLLDYRMYYEKSYIFLTVLLPIAIVNGVLIVLPAFALQYNLPKLIRLHEKNIKRTSR